ncbi:hypothetical protein D3C87_123220 [compost metagenome]
MNKILLVFEDYGELMGVESSLKRVGFDVLGISNEYSLSEQVLSFNPEVVIGSGRGGKVNSIGVGKRLKEMTRWQGKSVLLFPPNFKPSPQDLIKIRVDMILESPVPPLRMVQVLAKLLGHDEAVLLERLNKAIHVDNAPKTGTGSGGSSAGAAEDEAFYVKGKNPEGSQSSEVGGRFSLQENPEDSQISGGNSGKTRGMEFRLGERMTAAEPETAQGFQSEGDGFADVDLKALERELLGGGEPAVERVEAADPALEAEILNLPSTTEESVGDEENFDAATASAELRKAEDGLAEKIAKYSALVADMKLTPKSTVSRVEARKRQRQLVGDWDAEGLKDQDDLRREFTKALFKK